MKIQFFQTFLAKLFFIFGNVSFEKWYYDKKANEKEFH